jgi:polyhydroxyalkanoate synthesis regulator phasin
MSYSRQPKLVHVVRSEEPTIDAIVREQWRLMLQEASDQHAEELGKVRMTQEELEERVIHLEEELEGLWDRERENIVRRDRRIVVVNQVSRDQAKRLVEDYMREHKTADTEELLVTLGIELRTLLSILDDLKAEGRVAVAETD